jgi:anti-anti-sigma regulatory factor
MASEVAHLVVTGESFPMIRLTGVLDAAAAPAVRFALLDVLAGQPEALLVDVAALRVADQAAVGVLRDVSRDTADWPGAPIVICGADDDGVWRGSGLPVWPDAAGALAALQPPDDTLRMTVDLEPVMGAARRSRELVTEACARWDCPELAGPACIVLTEMVNNVVAHARTPMSVMLARHGDTMTVAVRDRSRTAPRFGGLPAPTSYGGRGLVLIDSVSSRWGTLELGDGKVVWARLANDQPAPGTAAPQMGDARMADPARG